MKSLLGEIKGLFSSSSESETAGRPAAMSSSSSSSATNNSDPPPVQKPATKEEMRHAFATSAGMDQCHALALWHSSSADDQSDLGDLIDRCIAENHPTYTSPLTYCLLIRIIADFLTMSRKQQPEHPDQNNKIYLQFIRSQLDNPDQVVQFEAAKTIVGLKHLSKESSEHKSAVAHLRNFLTCDKKALRFASVRLLNELATTSTQSIRFWSVHRISGVCKLHLLNKRYRIGDQIIGLLDFTNTKLTCAKYTVLLQCEETQQHELKQEFSLGLKRSDIMITIPNLVTDTKQGQSILHCVLSFLFYIADENYSKTLFEDRAGTIELGPGELNTKLFSCDFPVAIHT